MAEPAPCTIESFRASDGYVWKYRHYPAVGPPRGRIVYLHGIQSHGGWYTHSCTQLSRVGFTVDFLDRRGSGLNEQDRGDAPSFRRLLDDVGEFLKAGEQQSACRTFLIAVSWGGKLGVALQKRQPGLVDGLALLCPGFFPRATPPFGERFRIAWSRLFRPRRLFPIPLNDPELFTANPHWLEFLRNDPLALHQATARLLVESFRLDGYVRRAARAVSMPVLLLLAEHDKIIVNEATQRFVASMPSTDKQIVMVDGAHHTLEFEPNPNVFLPVLQNWLETHTSQAK